MNTLHSQMRADMVLRGLSPRTQQHYRGRQRGAAATRPPRCLFPADGAGRPDVLAAKSSASRHSAAGELEELNHGPPEH